MALDEGFFPRKHMSSDFFPSDAVHLESLDKIQALNALVLYFSGPLVPSVSRQLV